ncbi:MAG: hypothetical protein JWM80_6131 [Cyanobacteria bacterium RYN_339]|nr:hypothetical protein [Cyanobacteria bacterium RYN_339]
MPRIAPTPAPKTALRVSAKAQGQPDPLEDGLAAATPDAYQRALIREVGGAVDLFNKLEGAKQRYQLGQATAGDLHAAETAMEGEYARLERLHDAGKGKVTNLDAMWRAHGLPLPLKPSDGHAGTHKLLMNAAMGTSLAVTMTSMAALFMVPSAMTFMIAGPIALLSGLLGGVLVTIQANGLMHQGEAPAAGKRLTSDSGYGLDSPESYKTALIYLTARTKMAQQQLAAQKDPDMIRLAKQELIEDQRALWALRNGLGETTKAAWKLQGFDVDAAWKTYGTELPSLASLNQQAVVPTLDPTARRFMQYFAGLIAIVGGAIGADLSNAGRLSSFAFRGIAALFRVHVVLGMAAMGLVGFFAGGAIVDGLNKVLGTPSRAK